jgi:hypothetical protein
MGRFLPADHYKGDANTIGGYMAVHDRPAAFEGSDGMSYSVELMVDRTADAERPYAAYILFLRWRRVGAQGVEGHLETDYLAHGATPESARAAIGRMTLGEVQEALETLLAGRPTQRRWWDAMREEE